ncbi:MAG: LptF/LptG family permease [Bacteroidota bacterium]
MKKLDKYIIGKFLRTFFFTALLFTLVAMVFDFSEKVKYFLEQDIPIKDILLQHYLNYIPYINGQLWALYALISVIFFTSRMAYNSEIISILNSGVSFRRMMLPYLMAGGFVALLYFVGNHIIIPLGDKQRLNFEHTYIYKQSDRGRMNDVHIFLGDDSKIYARYYSKADQSIRNFRLEGFEDGELVYLLKASKAEYVEETNKWRLHNYEVRTFDGMQEGLYIGKNEKMDTTLDLQPRDFVYYKNQKQGMTTRELSRFISREQERGIGNTKIYEVEMHERTAEAFTVIILVIIGMAVASRKVRGGMGLHLALGIGIGALYILLSKFAITFATSDMVPPLLGVWIPNLIFIGVASYLVANAQK